MAGASAKKTAKHAGQMSKVYWVIATAATLINVVARIGWFREGYLQATFLAAMAYLSYRMIVGALDLGVGFDLWQDLFVINTAVQVLSLFSQWFWVIYLAVPGYGIYVFGGKILSWVFTPREDEVAQQGSEKKKAKKNVTFRN